jgi:hypothetical protein
MTRPEVEKPEVCRIEVVCQSAGHLHVDWERVPLELVAIEANDIEAKRVLARGVLDARGRWSFSLPSGPQEQSLRFRNPLITLELPAMAFVAGFAGSLAEMPSKVGKSDMLSATWKIHIVNKKRVLNISVRALDPSLQHRAVRIEILTMNTGQVRHSATLDMTYDNGMSGVLEIREALLGLSENKDLKVEVRPATGKS